MPVLSSTTPSKSGQGKSERTNIYIFGSLALLSIFILLLQKRLDSNHQKKQRRRESGKYAGRYSHDYNSYHPSHHTLCTPEKSGSVLDLDNSVLSTAAPMSPSSSALSEKYSTASASPPLPPKGPLQSNSNTNNNTTSSIMAMRPSSSQSQHEYHQQQEWGVIKGQGEGAIIPETQQSHSATALNTPPSSSGSGPSSHGTKTGAKKSAANFEQNSQTGARIVRIGGGGAGEAASPEVETSQAKSRILRPPQQESIFPGLGTGSDPASQTLVLGANNNNSNNSKPASSTSASNSSSYSPSSSLIHPEPPSPSISKLTTNLPPTLSLQTQQYQHQSQAQSQSQSPQIRLPPHHHHQPTIIPSPTEYTSFEALYSQNPPYYHLSSPSPEEGTQSQQQQPPRRRSYTKSLSNGSEVTGEIIISSPPAAASSSSSGVETQGWRRHTRVFGGGVCKACEESSESLRRLSA